MHVVKHKLWMIRPRLLLHRTMLLSRCRKQYRARVAAAAVVVVVIVPTKEEESARLIPTVDGDVLLIGNVLLCDYDEDAPEKHGTKVVLYY